MITEKKHKTNYFTIDTDGRDPVMIVGILKQRYHEMYDIIVDGETVIVSKVPYIEI